jgi:DNA-binding transcriptional LysR family regulator
VQKAPATRLRLRSDVLAGTWEALVSGQVDLAIGVSGEYANPGGIECGRWASWPSSTAWRRTTRWPRCRGRWSDAQLVHHRAVAVADTAQRMTPDHGEPAAGAGRADGARMRAKLEALLRGLGCGFLPEPLARAQIDAGRLVLKPTAAQRRWRGCTTPGAPNGARWAWGARCSGGCAAGKPHHAARAAAGGLTPAWLP